MKVEKQSSRVAFFIKLLLFLLLFTGLALGGAMLRAHFSGHAAEPTSAAAIPTVVIDAGHGGRDGGAVALSSIPEKEINLDIALTLGDMLKASGIPVLLTRTEDVMLTVPDTAGMSLKNADLAARLRMTEEVGNAVFVSIHQNSFGIEKYRGLQVWYSQNDEKSKPLAEAVQSAVHETLGNDCGRVPKPATSSIYLLHRLDCPAILIECGFLSNAEEAELLSDPDYRRELAFVIAEAIFGYLSDGEIGA